MNVLIPRFAKQFVFCLRKPPLISVLGGISICLIIGAASGYGAIQTPAAPANPVKPGNAAQTDGTSKPVQIPKGVLPESEQLVSIPYVLWQGLPVINAYVNGREIPERLVLDTGLNVNTVTDGFYTRNLLIANRQRVKVNVLDFSEETDTVDIKTFKVGSAVLKNLNAARYNTFTHISRSPRTDAPEGWLGVTFFSNYQAVFDFPTHFLTLNRPGTPIIANPESSTIPLSIRDGRCFVQVTIPKIRPFMALIDTGAVNTLIPAAMAAKLKLKPIQVVQVSNPRGQTTQAALAILPELSVGKIKAKNLQVVYLSSDQSSSFDKSFAVIGLNFLDHYRLTLDISKKRVTFTPPPSAEAPPPEDAN